MWPVKDQFNLRIRAFLKLLSEKKIIIGSLGTKSRTFQAKFHIFTSHSPNSLALDLIMKFSCLNLNIVKDSIYTANYEFNKHYENITIQIYWKKKKKKKKKKKHQKMKIFR